MNSMILVVAGFVLLNISSATFFAEHKMILVQPNTSHQSSRKLVTEIESYVKVRG